jgi:hypothetical protein
MRALPGLLLSLRMKVGRAPASARRQTENSWGPMDLRLSPRFALEMVLLCRQARIAPSVANPARGSNRRPAEIRTALADTGRLDPSRVGAALPSATAARALLPILKGWTKLLADETTAPGLDPGCGGTLTGQPFFGRDYRPPGRTDPLARWPMSGHQIAGPRTAGRWPRSLSRSGRKEVRQPGIRICSRRGGDDRFQSAGTRCSRAAMAMPSIGHQFCVQLVPIMSGRPWCGRDRRSFANRNWKHSRVDPRT